MEIESEPLKSKQPAQDDGEITGCSTIGVVAFIVGLIGGTFSALTCKMAYDTASEGIDHELKLFQKPIMMLLLMFAAMIPPGVVWMVNQALTTPDEREVVSWKTMGILIIPSICDLLCTLLLLVAQLYITASLWQMMRGSIIIITALLKRFALNHKLKMHMWLGVGVITLAMLLVASTSFFAATPSSDADTDTDTDTDAPVEDPSPDDAGSNHPVNTRDPRVGILLVVLGCLAQGIQYVFEEKVMSVDSAPPLVVIGCEGMWGTVLTLLIVYPISYALPGDDNGSFEDPFDALEMLRNNKQLSMLALLFVLTVTVYNCTAVYVTKYLSAIWHAILDNFRPITIWGMDLAFFYLIMPGSGIGEAWVDASWMQLGGLCLLLFGTAIYNGSVCTFSDMQYMELTTSEREVIELKRADSIIKTELSMASPSMTRSPLIYQGSNIDAHPGVYIPSPAAMQRYQHERAAGGYHSADHTAVRRSSYDA